MNKYIAQNARLKEAYLEISVWSNYINETDIIFDIGTNVGLYTIALSKQFPNSKIHSFDPMVSVVKELWYDNIKNNNINNAKFYPFGFSDVSEVKQFLMPIQDSSDDIEVYGYNYDENYGDRPIDGRVKTLSEFVNKLDILPNVIKIDAEGAELDIINGGLDVVLSTNTLIIEMPDRSRDGFRLDNTNKIHDILIKNNFKYVNKTAKFNRIYTKND